MRRRRAAFGRELDRRQIPYALVYGANRSGSTVSWLTGWPVTREALLVVAPEQDDDVLGNGEHIRATGGNRPDLVAEARCRDCVDHGPW